MANSGVTMLGMAKKKPGRPPTGRKPTYTVYVRIDPAVGAALEEHIKSIQPKTTETAVVELAIRFYLESVGMWPPPPSPAP
jgi:hypothetical protein